MQRERRGSSVGSDENISGAKIAPLDSDIKRGVPHADSHGVVGEDEILESIHIGPFPERHHPPPPEHAQSHKKHGHKKEMNKEEMSMGGMHHQRHHQAAEHAREKAMMSKDEGDMKGQSQKGQGQMKNM